jgi:probable selenium-dependent hydroxylase accessory protein YqeC
MKAWYQINREWIQTDSLLEALGPVWPAGGCVAVVGSGGKTSAIFQLAKELASLGKSSIITTTTHMFREPGALAVSAEEARRLIMQQSVLMAGRPVGEEKIAGLAAEEFEQLRGLADFLLVEADGSKRLPLKLPADHEPVIPEGTERILVLAGLQGIGRQLSECCHRAELVRELLQAEPDYRMGPEDVRIMLEQGYLNKHILPRGIPGVFLLNQADYDVLRAQAMSIADELSPYPCIITQLRE